VCPESHENGTFASVTGPDGNKVELWQPMLRDDKNKRAYLGWQESLDQLAALVEPDIPG
jgi:hypothetical protein